MSMSLVASLSFYMYIIAIASSCTVYVYVASSHNIMLSQTLLSMSYEMYNIIVQCQHIVNTNARKLCLIKILIKY